MLIIRSDNPMTINTGKDIWTLVFLEDGRHLLSGGREEIIRQWHIEDAKEVEDQRLTASGHKQVTAIALSADGNWIVSGGQGAVSIWNRKTRKAAFTSNEHSDWVNEAHVSPESTRFATASDDKKVIIWNISNGKPLVGPLYHENVVESVKFSPDGNRIATAVRNGEMRIYNAHNGQLLGNIAVAFSKAIRIAWSGDSHIFALSSGNVLRHVYVDTPTFLSEWTIPSQPHDYASIALASNGRFVAAFVGSFLTFWDTATSAQLGPFCEHPDAPRLYSIALSPDNNYVATGGYGGIITLRNLSNIIPMSYRVDRNVGSRAVNDTRLQIEALRSILRGLESRSGMFYQPDFSIAEYHITSDGPGSQLSGHAQAQITPLCIPNGAYRIKSKIDDLYLMSSRDGTFAVVVQTLDQSDVFQRVRHHSLEVDHLSETIAVGCLSRCRWYLLYHGQLGPSVDRRGGRSITCGSERYHMDLRT